MVLTPIDGDLLVKTFNLFDIFVSVADIFILEPEYGCIVLVLTVPLKSTDGINIVGLVKGLIVFTFNCVLTAKGDVCIIVPLDKTIEDVFNSVDVKLLIITSVAVIFILVPEYGCILLVLTIPLKLVLPPILLANELNIVNVELFIVVVVPSIVIGVATFAGV